MGLIGLIGHASFISPIGPMSPISPIQGFFHRREEVSYEKSKTLRTSERTETGYSPGRRGRAPSRRDGQLTFELGGREDRRSDTRTLLPEEAGGHGASRGAIGEGAQARRYDGRDSRSAGGRATNGKTGCSGTRASRAWSHGGAVAPDSGPDANHQARAKAGVDETRVAAQTARAAFDRRAPDKSRRAAGGRDARAFTADDLYSASRDAPRWPPRQRPT